MIRATVSRTLVSGACSILMLGLMMGTAIGHASELEAPDFPAASAHSLPSLTLDDVTRSTREHFPLLQAIRMEAEARAEMTSSARGAFDTSLSVAGAVRPLGFYESRSGSVSLDQPTRWWGSRLYARYRYGTGDFPSYYGDRLTDSSGEASVGIEVPLLRGGIIDPARAQLERANLDQRSFDPELELERIEIVRDASLAYWEWLATGKLVEVTTSLLEVAEARQSQIARRVSEGQEAAINLSDNQRLVVERRAKLRGAQRDFRQAAILLSMFLRDDAGRPLIVDESHRPPAFPEEKLIEHSVVEVDLERARTAHPRLRKLAIEREKLDLARRLARNDVLPSLALSLEGARDFGNSRPGIDERGKLSSDPRSSTEVSLAMRLELPVLQRRARGRAAAARIRLDQLERRAQFTVERIRIDALYALEALDAAFDQTSQARLNVELAEVMRRAEARRLGAGRSNLIDLNIREVQAADAARELVQAQVAFFRALTDYHARVARDA